MMLAAPAPKPPKPPKPPRVTPPKPPKPVKAQRIKLSGFQAAAPKAATPPASVFTAGLKGLIPWKTVMKGGLPMVAGLSGLMRGQNTMAPLFEGRDPSAAKTAAYEFGVQCAHLARRS